MYGIANNLPVPLLLAIEDVHGERVFTIDGNGATTFGPHYDEDEALRILRSVFGFTSSDQYVDFAFRDAANNTLIESKTRGEVSFSPKITDRRVISLFRRMAHYVGKCTCGADSCGHPNHSSWCDKV